MDRKVAECLPRMQVSFIDYVVRPLVSLLVDFRPECAPCLGNLLQNRETWQKFLDESAD